MIVGLMPGPKEPKKTSNSYLTPLITELLQLWDGINIVDHKSESKILRCALICVACDLPAARKVTGFLSHSANLGCSYCFQNFGTGQFGKQNYGGFNRGTWVSRTNQKHRSDVEEVLKCSNKTERTKKESELGCRYSCLLELPYFDPIKMVAMDPMHNLYLGTAKHIFSNIWLRKGTVSAESVNKRILLVSVTPNVSFHRLPASIESRSYTAEQWLIWVNYYSIVCLYDLLPNEELEYSRHFVLASRLLCKSSLSVTDLSVADALLLRFCDRFERIYGSDVVTPNIHLHCHLVECIEQLGPMTNFWCFLFERLNGLLGDEPTNNRAIEIQLIKQFLADNTHYQLLCLANSIPKEDQCSIDAMFCDELIPYLQGYESTKHLDHSMSLSEPQNERKITFPLKYTIGSFSKNETTALSEVYKELFPQDFRDNEQAISQTFKKRLSLTLGKQSFRAGQTVSAKNVFPLPGDTTSIATVCTDQTHRAAVIEYFATHSVVFKSNRATTNT